MRTESSYAAIACLAGALALSTCGSSGGKTAASTAATTPSTQTTSQTATTPQTAPTPQAGGTPSGATPPGTNLGVGQTAHVLMDPLSPGLNNTTRYKLDATVLKIERAQLSDSKG